MTTAKAKNNNSWIWNLIRGIFALALGLYLIFATRSAPIVIAYALAIYMAISGLAQTIVGFGKRRAAGSMTDRIRGLVGLIGGGALLALAYFDVLSLSAAYTLLAILLIAYGLLGLFEALIDRGEASFRWMPVFINLALVALGAMVFFSRSRDFDLRLWGGIVLAAIGFSILGYVFLIQRKSKSPELPAGV